MSSTLLRLGLWIVLIVVALYVLGETYEGLPIEEFFAAAMLQKALVVGVLLVAAGFVTRMLEKGAKVVTKNRCITCKTPIPSGAIYCREHLRNVLHREEDRSHQRGSRSRP
jgi:hypothetical protein